MLINHILSTAFLLSSLTNPIRLEPSRTLLSGSSLTYLGTQYNEIISTHAPLANGNILIAFTIASSPEACGVAELSRSGSVIWAKSFTVALYMRVQMIRATQDGGSILVIMILGASPPWQGLLSKLDS